MIRLLMVLVVIVPATIWYGISIVWGVMSSRRDTEAVCDCGPRTWAGILLRWSGVKVRFENVEAIDPSRPQVMVANHTSWFDVLALTAHIPGKFVFVAKKELRKVPFFGGAAAACGHIFIDRQDRGQAVASLGIARKNLEEASPTIIMFPEGTRSKDGELMPFKKGAFVLAIQTGTDVIPAAIFGSRDVMKKGSLFVHAGTITIRFGEPIPVTGMGMKDRNELTQKARAAVQELMAS